MKSNVRYKTFDQISLADSLVYSQLPVHPFWSHLESKIDFTFADTLFSVLYSGRGQHPYAPSLKLKIHLIQTYYNLSDRQMEEKIIGDLFIKRFLGLPVDFFGFDHSTIGLDRSRMGAPMFHACHLYILAQMYSHGLWGDANEQWIMDSFPSNASLTLVGSYQLIQQSVLDNLLHLKHTHPELYALAEQTVPLDAGSTQLSSGSSTSDRMLAFSKLVAQAYGLLQWFETESAALLFYKWPDKNAQQKSLQLQAVLKQILEENSRPSGPDDGGNKQQSVETEADTQSESTPEVEYEKIPRKQRPGNRILSTVDPEARIAKKNKFTKIMGYKVQNLCTTPGFILDARAIPANEHDRDAMVDMVKGTVAFFRTLPNAVLGDTLYGHGEQRVALEAIQVKVVAPVVTTKNPTGLYDISNFTYNRDRNTYLCPNGKETIRKARNNKNEGAQHFFAPTDCKCCPLKKACTPGDSRSIFHSDYYDVYKSATRFNETTEGRALLLQRRVVERKNKELKIDCGLGAPRTQGRLALDMRAKLAAIVVNLKLMVRRVFSPSPGFLRRGRLAAS